MAVSTLRVPEKPGLPEGTAAEIVFNKQDNKLYGFNVIEWVSLSTNVYSFPQGVASGDPKESSVVLWTRVVPERPTDMFNVTVQISESAEFTSIIATQQIVVTSDSDYTISVLVDNLGPGTFYWYRFQAGEQISIIGRTKTAPLASENVDVNLAWVNCQKYDIGFYNVYRKLIYCVNSPRILLSDHVSIVDRLMTFSLTFTIF